MLWGDLHTLFEPDKDDEIWRDQHEYNLLSWRLCDFCGIHILLMDNGLAIHMLTEKKYPLSQEMLTKMLSRKLEVDHESSQAFELLRFIRSQVQKIDQGVGSTSGIRACALRNFDLGKMELENSQNNALAKLPMLKLGEYEMWEIRIKQYFQIQERLCFLGWYRYGNSWLALEEMKLQRRRKGIIDAAVWKPSMLQAQESLDLSLTWLQSLIVDWQFLVVDTLQRI
ncbi:hypothetical protein Tco_0498881 [Tanacetum coccineum]